MECRQGCAACCIAPSISSPIPGMPKGKKAGERCIQLNEFGLCKIFGSPLRPKVCISFKPNIECCGKTNEEAFLFLNQLEIETTP